MIAHKVLRLWLLLALAGTITLRAFSADAPAPATEQKSSADSVLDKPVAIPHVSPGPLDGQIAKITSQLLEQMHYLHKPFNQVVSSKFLDRYLEAFDPQHVFFLQSDLDQFEHYRTNLHRLTNPVKGLADTHPACEIFNRFAERLHQRVDYVDELLKSETFTFDTDERITINRKDMAAPKDLDEAKRIWRDILRWEYLQEHLGKISAKNKPEASLRRGSFQVKFDGTNSPGTDSSVTTSPQIEKTATDTVKKSDSKPKTEREEIVETINRRYHRLQHAFAEWNNDDVLQYYLNTLAHVYDPHSDYFGHAQLEQFAISMNLSLFGIGAELRWVDGYCTIGRLLPGGPAEKSKQVQVGDRIIAVSQSNQPPVDVIEMTLTKAVQLIRGPKGTEVRLTMIPADSDSSARKEITLIRDEIKLEDSAAKARIIDLTNSPEHAVRLGVIDLPSFYAPIDLTGNHRTDLAATETGTTKSTSADVALLLKKLKQENVEGVILDLRRNGGGSLEEAVKLTGLFIKEGPVVQVKDFQGHVQADSDTDPSVTYDGPLIVLTSRGSASASEIVAGALQDYGRALVVGESSTHGKGTVQNVNNLKPFMIHVPDDMASFDPGALKLTIKKFYRASGSSTQLRGVIPDMILPSVANESKESGEASLENPLPYDTIDSAKYDHLDLVAPYLADLTQRSNERISKEPEFDYVREDIELDKKQRAEKTASLNEKVVLKEREEREARVKERNKERRARPEPPEKVYDLTLKQVNLPGLPPPVEKTNSTLALAKGGGQSASVPTNSASLASQPKPSSATPDLHPEEEPPPTVDAMLEEAEHILLDYISVFPKRKRLDGRPVG